MLCESTLYACVKLMNALEEYKCVGHFIVPSGVLHIRVLLVAELLRFLREPDEAEMQRHWLTHLLLED